MMYTVDELAERWKLSYNTVLRMIKLESGVLVFGNTNRRRRSRPVYRIPQEIVDRIEAKAKQFYKLAA